VLEVGGNIGLFSVLGARASSGKYTVVEPIPANAAVLRSNLARNGLSHAEVIQAAVIPGNDARDVVLNLPAEGRDMLVGAHLVEDVEVQGRTSTSHLTVTGVPIRQLAAGRDLIKIDAEGIEAMLLADIHDVLIKERPTLLIEVLPEATRLGEMLSSLATEAVYYIHLLPEWGSDTIVTIPAKNFTSMLPGKYNSKDVVLSTSAILIP
jgi:FkbM family methyltransferase